MTATGAGPATLVEPEPPAPVAVPRRPTGRAVRARRRIVAFAACAATLLVLAIVAAGPVATAIVENWARRDLDLRATLVNTSIRQEAARALRAGSPDEAILALDRLTADTRLMALGFCDAGGTLVYSSREFPPALACAALALGDDPTFAVVADAGERLHVGAFPLRDGTLAGHFLVVHDMTFLERRTREARLFAIAALGVLALGLAAIAVAAGLVLLRRWSSAIGDALSATRSGEDPIALKRSLVPGGHELYHLLKDIRRDHASTDGIYVEWSPRTLTQLLGEELPDTEIIVVSNREPYSHERVDGAIRLHRPAGGLVSAIEPVMRACRGTWIASGSGSADRETVDARSRLAVPPGDPAYTLRRVFLSEAEQEGFYYGYSNDGLWPLCHIAFVRPAFRESDWEQYQAVNRRFADAVVEESTRDDPIVLIQDYHFALLPQMIRQRLPRATIVTFWHIPWPNPETFSICPQRQQILEGLLGSSIVGFHTRLHCNNFLDSADRFLESRIDREELSVSVGGRAALVRAYPISIEWPPAALAGQPPPEECRRRVRERFALPADTRIAVGVERLDYTKGILDRLVAVDELLTVHPAWVGKFVFIQAAAPSRTRLAPYGALEEEATRLADDINARHGRDGMQPIRLEIRHHEQEEVFELFRAADLCVVSSLHDGMNLVAKEFVASRDDEAGVLVLSRFAGASHELEEALIVNPYDSRELARAIDAALLMPAAEQRERMRLMRDQVRYRNVYRWAAQILRDAARTRQRDRIGASAAGRAG